jgi:hypothetical protein
MAVHPAGREARDPMNPLPEVVAHELYEAHGKAYVHQLCIAELARSSDPTEIEKWTRIKDWIETAPDDPNYLAPESEACELVLCFGQATALEICEEETAKATDADAVRFWTEVRAIVQERGGDDDGTDA